MQAIMVSLSFFLFPSLLFLSLDSNEKKPALEKESAASLEQTWVRTTHGNNVKVYQLEKGEKTYGHSIWISRKSEEVNAKYFAFKEQSLYNPKTVHGRYQDWKQGKEIVLACSGAFSTELPGVFSNDAITVGLTVDNGRIVNRRIDLSMDGLVIVYATGGIAVSDIENKNLALGSRRISVIDEKAYLLNWAEKKNATVFQTQLLAFENTLRISRAGRKESRERRFLALARSSYGELYHIIFDLPRNNFLFDAARDIFYFLKDQKDMEVVALLNLDTGAYNVLELFEDNGWRDNDITGGTDIKLSTNLIVYHFSD